MIDDPDAIEPGTKIADVLPDDLRTLGKPEDSDGVYLTPCCEVRFKRKELWEQHVQRWKTKGICLGSGPT